MLKVPMCSLGLMVSLVLTSGCGGENLPCAVGPSYIESATFSAVGGRPIDVRLPLDAKGDGTGSQLRFISTSDMPTGLTAGLDGDAVQLSGSVAQTGDYAFVVVLHHELENACSPWARYDVALQVVASAN